MSHRLLPGLTALLFLLAAAPAAAQPMTAATPASQGFSPERLERMHALLERMVKEGKHAGVIGLVARNGRVVDWQVYGMRDLGAKLPMEKDTIVRAYSMSKVISSVAVMILHEEGRLKLTDPVGKYLPALEKMKVYVKGSAKKPTLVDAKRQMTVKDLLTHTSGLIYGFGKEPIDEIYRDAKALESSSMDDFVQRAPGFRWRSSLASDSATASASTCSARSSRRSRACPLNASCRSA